MRREPFADEVLERLLLDRLPHDDVRPWNRQPVPGGADDRALDDIRMADEAVLDLGRSDPDPADLDQVVDAPSVPEEPVVVALEQVARVDGVAIEGAPWSSPSSPQYSSAAVSPVTSSSPFSPSSAS